jgi:hypothetical protein
MTVEGLCSGSHRSPLRGNGVTAVSARLGDLQGCGRPGDR